MRSITAFFIVLITLAVIIYVGWTRAPTLLSHHFSRKMGVNVSIHGVDINNTKIKVHKLEIGNPRGYTLPRAFSSEIIVVLAPLANLFKREVFIDTVIVDGIYLGLEFDSPASTDGNWKTLLTQYDKSANLEAKDGKKVHIKKLVFKDIRSEILFKGKESKQLPVINSIVLTDIGTEGGFPLDQLMSSILGQMIKDVFVQENLKSFLDAPGNALEKFLEPFKGIFNAVPEEQIKHKKTA